MQLARGMVRGRPTPVTKKKIKAAAVRKQRAGTRLTEAVTLRAAGMSALRQLSVQERTREKYNEYWMDFTMWAAAHNQQLAVDTADALLAEWMEHEYMDGWNPKRGNYMLAALKFMMPQFSRGGL